MILDDQNTLSNDQAITATAASEDYIDLGPIDSTLTREMGYGVPLDMLIQVTEAFAAAGAATLTIDLEVDDNTGFSSATTVWTSGAIGKATLIQGYQALLQYVPKGVNERYLRLNYTVATGPMTAGKITAAIGSGGHTNLPH